MLYDSHCHLDHASFDGDRGDVLERARGVGVERVLVPAVRSRDWPGLARMRSETVRIAMGVHPFALRDERAEEIDVALAKLADEARSSGAVAIGECGLDARIDVSIDRQRDVLEAQLEVARELALPVVLHVVGARGAALEIAKRHGHVRGVAHAFSGSLELARQWIALGWSIGVGPALLRGGARKIVEIARELPLDSLVVETDAPDGTLPGRTRGEPADVAEVVRALAEIRGVSIDAIANATFERAAALFDRR